MGGDRPTYNQRFSVFNEDPPPQAGIDIIGGSPRAGSVRRRLDSRFRGNDGLTDKSGGEEIAIGGAATIRLILMSARANN